MSNKDEFDTTYRKQPRNVITGYDADADTYNRVHVDANGHLFSKMVGDAGATNVALACDADGHLQMELTHQGIDIDTNNTYSGTINGSATKTCTGSELLEKTAIQVYLQADQNCVVYVDQADALANLGAAGTITDSYNYYAAKGNGSIVVLSAASFFRVRVKNLSASIANVVLETASVPILSVLPRSLDDEGYLQTGVKSIRGQMGRVRISPMGAMKVGTGTRLAGNSFMGGTVASPIAIDVTSWVTTATGSGAVTQGGGMATLTTAATANSSCLVTSVRTARYVGGNPNYYRGNIVLPSVTTASAGFVNIRRWGAFDANDGYFFRAIQTNPATTPTLSIVSRKETSDTNVTSFNGDYGTSYVLDNNVHTYEIWWSNKKTYFFIDDILLHTITATTTTNIGNPSLKVGLQTINSGDNTGANTLVAMSSMIIRLGNLMTQPTSYYHASGTTAGTQIKTGTGNIHSIIFGSAANNAVLTLVDNTTGSTPVLWVYTATGALDAPVSIDLKGMPFSTGLRFVVATGNASFTVVYE
jgi:hypothetical protein